MLVACCSASSYLALLPLILLCFLLSPPRVCHDLHHCDMSHTSRWHDMTDLHQSDMTHLHACDMTHLHQCVPCRVTVMQIMSHCRRRLWHDMTDLHQCDMTIMHQCDMTGCISVTLLVHHCDSTHACQ